MFAREALDGEISGASAGEPGLVAFLDCLAELDGRIRLILDREGTIVAGPRDAASLLGPMVGAETLSSTGKDAGPCHITAFPRLAERLLKVRGGQTEIAMLERADGGGPIILRASAIGERHV